MSKNYAKICENDNFMAILILDLFSSFCLVKSLRNNPETFGFEGKDRELKIIFAWNSSQS